MRALPIGGEVEPLIGDQTVLHGEMQVQLISGDLAADWPGGVGQRSGIVARTGCADTPLAVYGCLPVLRNGLVEYQRTVRLDPATAFNDYMLPLRQRNLQLAVTVGATAEESLRRELRPDHSS